MSFSQGFRDGLGLYGDAQERALNNKRLDEQKRQGDLDRDMQTQRYNLDREATALYRKGQNDNQLELNRIRGVDADSRLLAEKNKEAQLIAERTRITSQSGLLDAQSAALTQTTGIEADRLSDIKKEEDFALNSQAFIDHIATGKSATARTPEWNTRADELLDKANGGLLSPFAAVDPDTKNNGAAFKDAMTAMQNGEDASRETLTPIINTFVRASNMRQIGAELTEQNTPKAGNLNGKGWKIIGKEVAPDWQVVDGVLTGTVDVTVQNAAGAITVYNAPLSSGRSGQELDDKGNPVVDKDGNPLPAVPLGIATEDLMKAASGYFKYAQYVGQFEDEIYQSATRLYDARNGTGSLEAKTNDYITNFQGKYAVGTMAGEASPIRGLTNAELGHPEHFNKLEKYAQYSVLDPSKNAIKPTRAGDKIIRGMSKRPEVTDLQDDLGRGLTRQEFLQAQGYFSEVKVRGSDKTKVVIKREDKKAWEQWKNKVLGIVKDPRSPANLPPRLRMQ